MAESLLARKIKTSTAEGRLEKSCVTPAGASTSLTSKINGMTTQHRHYENDLID